MKITKTSLAAIASVAALAMPFAGAQAQLSPHASVRANTNAATDAAATAVKSADTAQVAADTAQTAADRALPGTAQNAADTAQVAADTAKSAADTAVVAADNAETNVAAAAADNAQDAADTAQSAANVAQDAAGSATASVGATAAATPADVKKGAMVHDPQGGMVGTIESVDANGAVIATGKARVQIPVASFAKNDSGLIISLTKTQLEAQAKATS